MTECMSVEKGDSIFIKGTRLELNFDEIQLTSLSFSGMNPKLNLGYCPLWSLITYQCFHQLHWNLIFLVLKK